MSAPAWRLALQEIKRLAVPEGREALGKFTLEGLRSMERALRNQTPIECALVSSRFVEEGNSRNHQLLDACMSRGVEVLIAPDQDFAELTGGRGLGDVFAILPLPPAPRLSDVFSKRAGRQLIVVGTETADPGNTGAMIRSALASGAAAFVGVGRCDPWHPKSVRTSMGSLFKLPILRMDLDGLLQQLRALEVETIATVCRDGDALGRFAPDGERMAIFMGSEAFGLPDELVARLDRRLTIELPEGVDSFSVNAACAVICYQLLRPVC